MEFADLFDPHKRDQAVRELADEDRLLAAVIATERRPTDSLHRDWLALDVAWFAIHCQDSGTAAAIIRRGLSVMEPTYVMEGFLRVTEYRQRWYGEGALARPRRDIPSEIEHLAAAPHGLALLSELARIEAENALKATYFPQGSPLDLVTPFLLDVSQLEQLLAKPLKRHDLVIARLWELGAHDIVTAAADEASTLDGSTTLAVTVSLSAWRAANDFLANTSATTR